MGRRGDRDPVIERLRARNEWKFAGVLLQADRALAVAWWTLLVLRGLLPALFAIAMGGLVGAVVLAAYTWGAPLLPAGAWLATHWLLRESGVWRDRETAEVREAQRHADYASRLAVEPAPAKEVRLFGLADWVIERFRSRRRRLFGLRWQATRLRERPVIWRLLLALAANVLVVLSLAAAASRGPRG